MEYIDVIIKCPKEYAEKVQAYGEEMVTSYLENIQIETAKDEYQIKIDEGKAEDIVGDYKVSVGIVEEKVEPAIEPVIQEMPTKEVIIDPEPEVQDAGN